MKAIFLVLVSLNLAYLGWKTWIVPEQAPPALNETDGVPRLVLIGEDPDNPSFSAPYTTPGPTADTAVDTSDEPLLAASIDEVQNDEDDTQNETVAEAVAIEVPAGIKQTPPPVEVAIAKSGLRCVSLGPFLNLKEATEATAMLNEAGLDPHQRLSETQVWFGHWVYLAAYKTRAEAIAVVENLRKNKVTDIYIEPSGPLQNTVSLGVFSEREHAETRAGAIRKFGISPQISDRYRDSSVYWVDFEMPEGQVIDPTQYQAAPNRVLRIEGRTCPAKT